MKCSVLLPVYNAGPPLRTAIESVLSQDEPDFEFLIIDDASSDESAHVTREYAARDGRIRAIFHEKNRGLSATLNEGLEKASSEFVVRMDQDDESLPSRIGLQTRFLRTRCRVVVAGTFVYHMGRRPKYDRMVTLPTDHEEIMHTLGRHNCIYHPSVILRKSKILALGGYRSEFKNAEDYDLWMRAGRVYELANIPLPLLRYRFSTTGMTLGKKWQQMFWIQMAVLSHKNPGRGYDELVKAVNEEIERMDKQWFLQQVALGTIQELTRLRLWRDALKVFLMFSRELGPRRNLEVASQFASSTCAVLLSGQGVC
jgi:glycosyltransferase involved in cell wall biosynthesis